jgi:hypothetical protein
MLGLMPSFLLLVRPTTASAQAASGPPVFAGLFGSRDLEVENPNNPGSFYTMILHSANDPAVYDELAYDPARGYGYEVLDPDDETDNRFGPFDDSPNSRGKWSDDLPDQAYDSFIGFKDFAQTCDASLFEDDPDIADPFNEPCSTAIDADGGIFRVDVPNGDYRFVGVFGDADNVHAHRILAENGGSGPPSDGAGDHVVLVHNFDQAQQEIGQAEPAEPGEGVYALVGFDDKRPPKPLGPEPIPQFVSMDENGMPIEDKSGNLEDTAPNSPVLKVTNGYIRFHLLQGNSNDGNGGPRDPNGGDVVFLEIYAVSSALLGDFDGSGVLDVADINALAMEVRAGTNTAKFDLNSDNLVNNADHTMWVKDVKKTWLGDANLDGEFSSADFVQVFQKGEYEDATPLNSNWDEGDWNGDGDFNSGDFVHAFQDGGYEKGPRQAANAVPEPNSMALLCVGLLSLATLRRRP